MLAQKQSITWPPRSVVIALSAATICCVIALLQLPSLSFSPTTGATEVSALATLAYCVPALLLISIVALTALQFNARLVAGVLAAAIASVICATIVAWVLNIQPPVRLFLVNSTSVTQPNEAQSWFPTGNAIRAASMLALLSITILLLALRTGAQVVRPLAWAVAVLTLAAPLMRLAVAAIASLSAPELGAPAPLTLARQAALAGASITSLAFILLTVACIGAALLASLRTQPAARSEWGARVRALIVVAVLGFTLTLWHMVRSAEVRQLQNDVDAALQESIRDVRTGMGNTLNSINRLAIQLLNVGWKPTPVVFAADARGFFHDYEAAQAVAITDPAGRILYAARRNPLVAAASRTSRQDQLVIPIPLQDISTSELGPLLADERSARSVTQAIQSKQPIRGVVVRDEAARSADPTFFSTFPIFDTEGQSPGAIVVAYRARTGLHQMLANTAPEFFIRIVLDGIEVYDRPSADGAQVAGEQFGLTNVQQGTLSALRFDITPSVVEVKRNLTWTPLLVLVFAWASLGLLSYALYSERRAQTLYRERERILNESLDLICTLDAERRYTTVNDASRRILGYDAKELIGLQFEEIAHPSEVGKLRDAWDAAQAGVRPPVEPLRFMHKDGRVVYLQGNAHWSAVEQLFYCDMRDVTEQHALETEREHSARTFNTGVEQAGCIVYEYLPQSRRIEWVGAVRALTGYESAELSAVGFEGWLDIIHPDDRGHVSQTLHRCLETHQPHTVDYRLRHKDGQYIPVLDRGRHVADEAGTQRLIGALIDLTSIRRQEQALRRSEERYRIIATQVGAVIVERDLASNRLQVHGPVEQIFGYSKEQMESRPGGRNDVMIHPDDRDRVLATVQRAQDSLSSYYIEYRRRHRGGHYIHVAARTAILAGPDGRADRTVTAYTDITERKQAEERLSASEERFRLAAEQARQIVYEYALGEQLQVTEVRVAGAVEQILGMTAETLRELQKPDRFRLIHPDDIRRVRMATGEAVDEQGQFHIEHRLQRSDGQYAHVENRGAVKRDAAGHIVGIVGMLLDISARKSAEADRQHYTQQLGMLADIARRVSTFLSLHELLNYLSRSMRDLVGANAAAAIISDPTLPTPGSVIAVSYADHYGVQRGEAKIFGSPELHEQLSGHSAPVRLTKRQTENDVRWSQLTQNDDLRHPLNGWLGVALSTRTGGYLGLLELTDKVSGDFTDGDVQILNQLAGVAAVAVENIMLYATLEERVAARTRELEISNRELEAFSYSVSHDLRAPLRAIAGFSSILEHEYGGKLDASARRYLQRIGSGVERMASLIDDLLSLARVSRLDIKRETIDLTAMCRAIAKRQRERWTDREIDVKVDARMRTVADPRLVEVALENLIENAIKFTSTRSSGHIHIGRRVIDGRAAFFVHDNGVGFDPQYASNLFGVFQRLHSASEFPGTGVGLATVQRIVQRHHGRVWAESKIDEGAVFYFTFESEA